MSYYVIIVILCINCVMCFLNVDIIKDYIEVKKFKYVNIFTCNKKYDNIKLFRDLFSTSLLLSVENVSNDLSRPILVDDKHVTLILDGDCDNLDNFFIQCNEIKLFKQTHHWLIMQSNYTKLRKLHVLNLNVNTDMKVIIPEDSLWVVYDIYKPYYQQKSALNVSYIGIYTSHAGFSFPRKGINMYEERRNMSGLQFSMAVVIPMKINQTVEEHVLSDENLELNHFDRMHAVLMVYCSDYYNYSIKMISTDSWGYNRGNNSFDGMVGALQRREIDFGGSPCFHEKDRYSFLDYGTRTWEFKSAFLFRHPKQKASFEVFFKPLDKYVWVSIAVFFVIIIIVLKFVCLLEIRILFGNKISLAFGSTWSNLALFIIGALCQQGSSLIPIFVSGRILIFFVFTSTVLLYQFYSGSVVSYLLMQPEQTLYDITQLSYSDLKVGCEDLMYNREYFKNLIIHDDIARLQKKTFKPGGPFFYKPNDGLSIVSKGGFAFHVELTTAYSIIINTFKEKEFCDLEKIPLFSNKPIMSAFPKGSSIRDMINHMMRIMEERGVLRRMNKHYDTKKPVCIRSTMAASAVGLLEFYPAFVILCGGLALSVVLLLCEIMVSLRK